jgi:AraC-like DNA-binding protein
MTRVRGPEKPQSSDRATWYREIAPPPEVADCVLCLWLMQVPLLPGGPTKVRILPNACIDIVVYRSDPSRGEGVAAIVAPPRRSYVVGSTLRDFVVRSIGWRHVIGASLRPEGVQPLLGMPAAVIADRVALLDDIIGPAAATIEDRVLSAAPERTLDTLGEVLVERRRASGPPNALIERAVRSVRRARGRQRIDALAADLNLSPRRLERHFLTHVGLSPKLFSRLVRFDRTVRHLASRGTATWADFASAHGYADQAHFINEFREFAGVPPEEFERENS